MDNSVYRLNNKSEAQMDHLDILIEALAKARNQAEEYGDEALIALTEAALVACHRRFAQLGKH